MTLREMLQQRVDDWEQLGHPALLERFVLRNGKDYTPAKRIGRKQKAKQCFSNATNFVARNGGEYVEGFTVIPDLSWTVHHAWVSMNGSDAMDPTLDAKGREYIGVAFDKKTLNREILRNGVYGILDMGMGLNIELMFKIDPELKEICERIRRHGNLLEKAVRKTA